MRAAMPGRDGRANCYTTKLMLEVPMRDVALALSVPLFTGYSRLRKARREFEAALRALQQGPRQP